jgi:hypothetical protein
MASSFDSHNSRLYILSMSTIKNPPLRIGRMLAHAMLVQQWAYLADSTDHMREPHASRFRATDAALARIDGHHASHYGQGFTDAEQAVLDDFDL